jgi:hypothetical protein
VVSARRDEHAPGGFLSSRQQSAVSIQLFAARAATPRESNIVVNEGLAEC